MDLQSDSKTEDAVAIDLVQKFESEELVWFNLNWLWICVTEIASIVGKRFWQRNASYGDFSKQTIILFLRLLNCW